MVRSVALGCGSYLPAQVMTNQDLAQRVDTSDDWIRQRTGITRRHVAADGETTSDLAAAAARAALVDAGLEADRVDLIVLATTTPDNTFPATAAQVQAKLGITHGAAFDVQAVCAGFIYALSVADSLLRSGQGRTALVIGAETFTRLLDWEDRSTCVLFGDGAGALVLQATETGPDGAAADGNGHGRADKAAATAGDRGVLSTHLFSDGRYAGLLYVDGGASTTGTIGHVRMEGQEVFRHAVQKLADAIDAALARNGLSASDVDWLIPHQANRRIINRMGKKLGLPEEKIVVTIDRHANTSAASIPLALAEAKADGRIKPGDLLLMEAIGGGLSWGSALLRW